MESLEEGLMYPEGGGLNEMISKFLLGPDKIQEMTVGEGQSYKWWNNQVSNFFVSIHIYLLTLVI